MQIGFFSGSFNPIHNGHIALAEYLLRARNFDQIWFSLSPQNPLKKQEDLLEDKYRWEILSATLKNRPGLVACNIELSLPEPSYTIDTLKALSVQYPEHHFTLLIGADNWLSIHLWKDYKNLCTNYSINIYPRDGFPIQQEQIPYPNVQITDAPLFNLSATQVRAAIAKREDTRDWLPQEAERIIKKRGWYLSLLLALIVFCV